MITDSHGRLHNYLRISLTDNCNLRCFYCLPQDNYTFTPPERLMQADEILNLARIFVANGVSKIRLTGGEPLVRKDAKNIIAALAKLPVSLTMTTNATRVHDFIEVLEDAKVKSLNVSLDTLHPDKFLMLTRRDSFAVVKRNIDLLINRGFEIKINAVVMKGINETEIIDFIEWTSDTPVQVRFIEFMPFNGNRWTSNKVFTYKEILEAISKKFIFVLQEGKKNDTAKTYRIPGHAGSFAVISTMTAPFCDSCNRIRLTADGKIKNCLFSADETDLLTAFRRGENVLPLIMQNISKKEKALGGQFTTDFENIHAEDISNRSMVTIGG